MSLSSAEVSLCEGPLLWVSERDLGSSADSERDLVVRMSERDLGSTVNSGQGLRLPSWTHNGPASISSLLFA